MPQNGRTQKPNHGSLSYLTNPQMYSRNQCGVYEAALCSVTCANHVNAIPTRKCGSQTKCPYFKRLLFRLPVSLIVYGGNYNSLVLRKVTADAKPFCPELTEAFHVEFDTLESSLHRLLATGSYF